MTDEITTQLEAALAGRGLPESARLRGKSLFESLSRPVKIALIGKRGSGKSTLANLFLGETLLPEGLSSRLIEVVPGESFAAEVVYRDGRLEAAEEDELAGISDADRVMIAAPCPVLRRIVLVEASSDHPATIDEVARDSDILLWCSPDFDATERSSWSALESSLRDHAFLILTKADKLARANRLADVLGDLQPIASSQFAGLFPVAGLQGTKALSSKPRDNALWKGSGAGVLIEGVLEHARKGRQADLDQAELLLARYALDQDEDVEDGTRPRSRVRTRQRSQAIRRRSRLTRPVTRQASRINRSSDAEAAQEVPQPQVAPAPAPKAAVRPRPTLADRLVDLRRTPSRQVRSVSSLAEAALSELRSTGAQVRTANLDASEVLSICARAADRLCDLFDGTAVAGDLEPVVHDIVQTREMMTLLQLEDSMGPAADAVTLLLQIRRDLEQRIAA